MWLDVADVADADDVETGHSCLRLHKAKAETKQRAQVCSAAAAGVPVRHSYYVSFASFAGLTLLVVRAVNIISVPRDRHVLCNSAGSARPASTERQQSQ